MRDTTIARDAAPVGPMREALLRLLGTGRAQGAAASSAAIAPLVPASPADAHDEEASYWNHVHPARAAAHAAFRAVVGGGPRALDAALAVAEAEARDLRLRCLAQEEALKILRLYAADEWARSVASHALDRPVRGADLPAFLHDPALAEGRPCLCGDRR